MTVRLRPGLLTAWRGPGILQLGTGDDAVVLDGLSAAEEHLLEALDGTCDEAALRSRAAAVGVPAQRLGELLRALGQAGALAGRSSDGPSTGSTPSRAGPSPSPRSRRPGTTAAAAVLGLAHRTGDGWRVLTGRHQARVLVSGASLTGLALARTLAAGGVGSVTLEDDAQVTWADVAPGGYDIADVGTARGAAAARRLAAEHPGVTSPAAGASGRARPDVVVLVATGAVDLTRADALVREGVVHLAVLWRGAETSVGPLVHPGASTCLRCLEAHRTDRDPQWPRVLSQLAGGVPGSPRRPEEPALATLTAALAAAQVLAEIDGRTAAATTPDEPDGATAAVRAPGPGARAHPRPAALDAVLEVTLTTGEVSVRPWTPHPRCGCTWTGRGWHM